MANSKELAPKNEGGALAGFDDYAADLGAGLDGDQLIIPWLPILQKGSPQVERGNEKWVRGAEAGMIYDSSLGQAYSSIAADDEPGITGIVFAQDHVWGVWRPRDLEGGGPRGKLPFHHEAAQAHIARAGSKFDLGKYRDGKWAGEPFLFRNEECELVEEYHLYMLYGAGNEKLTAEMAMPAVVGGKSTQIKPLRELLNRLNRWSETLRAPIFAFPLRFRTVYVQDGANTWYNWKIELEPPGTLPRAAALAATDPLIAYAADLRRRHREGGITIDESAAAEADRGDSDEAPF